MALNRLILLVLMTTWASQTSAEVQRVEMALPAGLTAEADFWVGVPGLPAVLVLHGFLQTRDFPTVRRLAEGLAGEGWTVLLPTLSLDLDRRRQSLACEAIHTHSMQTDLAELRAWVVWLTQGTGHAPVLVGHSAGGIQLTALLDASGSPPIAQAVLISLAHFGSDRGHLQVDLARTRAFAAVRDRQATIDSYALAYCRRYVTTPAALLSYLEWDKPRTTEALRRAALPITLIYGSADERIDQAWLQALAADNVTVRAIPGANHFYDLAYEFDLLDAVLAAVGGASNG